MRCENCGTKQINRTCPSCELYNAAVAAQNAAAKSIAKHRGANPNEASWINEYGIFGMVKGVYQQIGTHEEAAPFFALTAIARKVTEFWKPEPKVGS